MADYGVRITLSASSPVPAYTGGIWSSGVAMLSSSSGASGWTSGQIIEVSPLGEQVDIAQGGNYASIGDFDSVVLATWFPAFEAAGASLYGATVEVGTLSGATLTVRWSGIVVDAPWKGAELRIRAESLISRRHKTIPARVLTAQEFPGIRSDAEGIAVPAIYGASLRTAPHSLLSKQDTRSALTISNTDSVVTETEDRTSTWVAIASGVPVVAVNYCPVVSSINANGGVPGAPSGDHWINDFNASRTVYLRIDSGTGSGQERKIDSVVTGGSFYSYTEEPTGNVASAGFGWIGCALAAPFDTLPDATSIITFFVQEVGAVLAAADEGQIGSVYSTKDGVDYTIAYTQTTPAAGIVAADISSEFRSGEDYAALDYFRPDAVYGVPALSDGLSASSGASAKYLKRTLSFFGTKYSDALCRGKLFLDSVPDAVLKSDPEIYLLASLDAVSATADLWVQFIGQRYDNTNDVICQETSNLIGFGDQSVNCYSPAILADGVSGSFSAYAFKVPALTVPLEQYRSFRFGIMVRDFPLTTDPTVYDGATWINGATSVIIHAPSGDPGVGNWIRPDSQYVPKETSEYYRDRFFFGSSHVGAYQDWRQITASTLISGDMWELEFADPITCPTDDYITILVPDADMSDATQYECGIAFVHSSIPKDEQFLVDFASGRTFAAHWDTLPSGKANGDPITNAAHVAQDILLRDLGLDQATEIGDGYDTAPSYPARVALVEQEDSAAILARMCREFNWVGGHDNAGKETLVPWLSRLYSASSDYSVTNADIVENSIDGIDATSVDDVVTLPRVSSDWTQKDGFRQSGTVTDCTASPSTLTASNYLQYISGFGDYSTALDSYSVLHEAWKRNGIRQSGQTEYRYGGDPTDLLVPARLEWAASRKDILTFKLSEEHAAAAAYVGQRVDITHKRYTGGGTAYGTLVARYWYPEDGQIQLTVMLDPVEFVIENQLYIDTIDASGATPLYIDQIDGVAGLYIDQTGA